ncbi:hypothetical protein [Actinoplanes teichomyceticus]|uniref:Uncharacterized protein n=1 Tax=Actinoplanes teichomyceticus TaxID=1867 RepID=A0A561VCF0_ACTTI|nr:hypothetical protein [Actinoplanes teichomyceticus]TWG09292.1 hypothetical protein FHX34_1087 [Actinoplanes teichomyceticus]GIF16686.1 hypothetical protein Ate01nite_67180 [Actinoplanes teichomyceticus]
MTARTIGVLLVALAAGGALLAGRADRPAPAPARSTDPVTVAGAWPHAQRADLPAALPDGSLFTPKLYLDAGTAIGTARTPGERSTRLLLRTAGTLRELRRAHAEFDNLAAAGDDVAWTETGERAATRIWAVNRADGRAPRRLTADTGNAVFFGNQHDLVLAGGRVHWAAAPRRAGSTEIRSVALTGGPVAVRRFTGEWALTAWPWLTSAAGGPSGRTRLKDMTTGRTVEVPVSAGEQSECNPAWCRVLVSDGTGLVRIDVMRPDGSARRRVAGATSGAAVSDVAILDRFEILSETGPQSDLTGTAGLSVHDLASARTVTVTPAATSASARGGMLWWSTGSGGATAWHSLDLRTV